MAISTVNIVTAAGVETNYGTPELAESAATSGDTVYVTGAWTVTGTFGKTNVRYYFAPGAKYLKASGDIWTGTAISYQVFGEGEFSTTDGVCVNLIRPANVRISGRRLSAGGSGQPAIKVDGASTAGNYEAHFKVSGEITSTLYDGMWLTGDTSDVVVRASIECETLRVGQNPLEFGLESPLKTPTVHCYVKANNIVSQLGSVICNAQQALGSCTIDAGQIWQATDDAAGEEGLLYSTVAGFNLTIRCPQIKSRIRTRAAGKVRIVGARIEATDWTGDAGTTGDGPIYVGADGLELENCEILSRSDATYSIQGAASTTIQVIGSLIQNKSTHTNVTIEQANSDDLADAIFNRFTASRPTVDPGQQYAQRTIIKGNSYGSTSRDFIVTLSNGAEWPTDLSLYNWTFAADIHPDNLNTGSSGYASITGTASVVTPTGDNRAVRVTLSSTTTGTMAVGLYTHSLRGTATGGLKWTVELGTLDVKDDPSI